MGTDALQPYIRGHEVVALHDMVHVKLLHGKSGIVAEVAEVTNVADVGM